MQLTEHFSLAKFIASETAARKKISNDPPPAIIANLTLLARALELPRGHFGRPLHVSSGYRSPRLNMAVGGSATSAHLEGLAADCNVAGIATIDLCRWIEANVTGFDQCIYEVDQKEGRTWCHFGLRAPGAPVRQQCLTIVKHRDGSVFNFPGIVEVDG